MRRQRAEAKPAAGVAGQGERGEFRDERGAKRRGEEDTAVPLAVPSNVATTVSVAMLAGRGVGPLARRAGAGEPDVERAAAGAVEVARDPVAALLAAMGEIAPADELGPGAERGGDVGRVHGAARRQGKHDIGMKDSSGLAGEHPIPAGLASRRRRTASGLREARARGRGASGLETGRKEKGPTREAPARSKREDAVGGPAHAEPASRPTSIRPIHSAERTAGSSSRRCWRSSTHRRPSTFSPR